MALWCSRLARQPVTLEVDGSSPFGVAKKERGCKEALQEKQAVPSGTACKIFIEKRLDQCKKI